MNPTPKFTTLVLVLAISPTAVPAQQPPAIAPNGLVNGASFASATAPNGSLAPGSIATLFGTNLASANSQAAKAPLPTTLSDTDSVTIGGIAAPLFFVSGNQINLQIPFEAGPGATKVTVTRAGQTSDPQTFTIVPTSPGIFTVTQNGQPAILTSQGALIGPATPAAPADIVQIFCTGLGATTPPVATGVASPAAPPASANLAATAAIGGLPATVLFAGLAPGFIGLNQINVQIPAAVAPGDFVTLTVASNAVSSNIVTLPIKSAPPVPLAFAPSAFIQHGTPVSGEPTLQIAHDGTLWVTDLGPAQIWKSTDRGATWSFIAPALQNGGADMDAAPDDSGRVHIVDQDNTSCIFYYRSSDGGKSFDIVEANIGGGMLLPGNGNCPNRPRGATDRPWVTTFGPNTVYFVDKESNSTGVLISRDGGSTFTHAVPANFPEVQGSAVDPVDGTLYLIGGLLGAFDNSLGRNTAHTLLAAMSPDGQNFSSSTIVNSSSDLAESEFPTIAVDKAHNVYAAWSDNSAGTVDVYVSVSRDRAQTWSAPVRVSHDLTVATYPTITAGDAGRVAVAWYGTSDPATTRSEARGASWYVYAAVSIDAASGSPTFNSVRVSDQPFHHNSICAHVDICEGQDVSALQLPADYERGLLDFFRIAVDPTGAINIVWPDTTQPVPQDRFTRQTAGPLLHQ